MADEKKGAMLFFTILKYIATMIIGYLGGESLELLF